MRKSFISGNIAIAEGAITAGMRFFAGYPITPASDIMEYLAERLPEIGGVVTQFEDEIASINAVVGASWAGVKSMTATSGPGFSLMLEALGLAVITETPLVVVDVMRAGPSTGVPTKTSQSDVMQVRYGAHGDYVIPVFAPWSAQEAYDLTIKAFNVAESLRTPVILLSDAVIAHLWESVLLAEPGEVEVINRKKPSSPPDEYLPYKPDNDLVPPMATFGEGYNVIVESLIHDERGFYRQDREAYRNLVKRIVNKVLSRVDSLFEVEAYYGDDYKYLLVSFGSTARSALAAARILRKSGIKASLLRLKTLSPLKLETLRKYCDEAEKIFVVENNMGKLVHDVERAAENDKVISLPLLDLEIPEPKDIVEGVRKWL
ncbi:MAG: 2-oxoacid:acceptor oxidoreductase subunit alpha [Desulfurococcaceae archaeon]|jgi:2-oxoglutarate ferredoxin oxidoreductase subunit alpha|nr:2-oxoacid:acceptor oxidoreductase subunit alpha [Desulfurococcaceae archaeon]